MNTVSDSRHRRSIRLKGYEYTQAGAYFITIVTQHRECFFGEIEKGELRPNDLGEKAYKCWLAIPEHHSHADLDAFVIMPNHVHGIVVIGDERRGVQLNAPTLGGNTPEVPSGNAVHGKPRDANNPFSVISPHRQSLGVIVRTFKAAVTTACRGVQRLDFGWQKNYYEHIVRNDGELERIRGYIFNNPFDWETDAENPAALRKD